MMVRLIKLLVSIGVSVVDTVQRQACRVLGRESGGELRGPLLPRRPRGNEGRVRPADGSKCCESARPFGADRAEPLTPGRSLRRGDLR